MLLRKENLFSLGNARSSKRERDVVKKEAALPKTEHTELRNVVVGERARRLPSRRAASAADRIAATFKPRRNIYRDYDDAS